MKTTDNNLKIAIIIRKFDISGGGAERYCVELTRLLSIKHNVHVFSQKISTRIDNVVFHEVGQKLTRPRFINQLIFSYKTKALIKNLDFDIVHSHDIVSHAHIYTAHVPCFKTFLTKSKGLNKFQHNIRLLFNIRKLTYLFLESRAFNEKKIVISVSKLLAKNIANNYKNYSNNFIAYPGISFNQSTAIKNKKTANFSILFIANNFRRKGLKYLIKAIELLNDTNIKLIVIGDDDPKSVTFDNRNVLRNTKFYGKVEDPRLFYQNADILVHPTHGDTYGMVVLEAMSYGVPVIVSNSDFCGISETLTDNIDSLILKDNKDVNEIALKILELKNNQKKSQIISANAIKFAEKSDWNNTMNSTLVAYKYHMNLAYRFKQ